MTNSGFQIGSVKIPNRLIMAPMCGITHKAFRRVVKGFGAGLVVTQMVSAKALTMRDKKTHFLLSYDEGERPIAFQIFGNNAETISEAAHICEDLGADMVDLNMGCPAKKIVNDGGGSALLRDESLVRDIFTKTRAAVKIPFTVKMRCGWDKYHNQALEIGKMAEEHGVNAVALHARTRAQGYSGQADWSLIKELKDNLSIPVIGNGDVKSPEDARRMLAETGCDAVMVGRGAVSEPWFFKSFLDGKDYIPTVEELRDLIFSQYEAFAEFFGPATGIKQMRKHLCSYTKGLRNGAEFRNKIIRMEDWPALQEVIRDFFHENKDERYVRVEEAESA